MQLDANDKKVLAELYHGYREPITQLAKKCKLSRDQVEYRIEKFEAQGLIRKYITVFNYAAVGYDEFAILFMRIKEDHCVEFTQKIEKMPQVISVGEMFGAYNLYVNIVIKNKKELEQILCSLEGTNILRQHIMFLSSTHLFGLKGIVDNTDADAFEVVCSDKTIDLDKDDWAIMEELEQNGRVRIIDIAKATKLSSEKIIYRLRQLYKQKVILGTRIQFDMAKIGFHFGTLLLHIRDLTIKEDFIGYCNQHSHINAVGIGYGQYNGFVQVMYKTEQEFRDTVKEVMTEFGSVVDQSTLVLLGKESEARTLPY